MLTMALAQRTDGTDIASCDWNGQRFEVASRHGVTMALARKLVAAGAPDDRWQAVGTDGGGRLLGGSLHGWARLTIAESDSGRVFRARRFVTRPDLHTGYAPDGVSPLAGSQIPGTTEKPLASEPRGLAA